MFKIHIWRAKCQTVLAQEAFCELCSLAWSGHSDWWATVLLTGGPAWGPVHPQTDTETAASMYREQLGLRCEFSHFHPSSLQEVL